MKALIAMSGGVDSSVAAALTQKKGYDCIGVTMKLYDNDDIQLSQERTCCSLDDIEDARYVARHLGMPYYVLNFKSDFRKKVMDKFVSCYMHGETPNPCIDCNRYLKFEALYHKAAELGCDKIATGHYARVRYNEQSGRFELLKGLDNSKDQSYVLYSLTQEQLSHTLFPLGDYTKSECRSIADSLGFINARKSDSQDICFVPNGDYRGFIEGYTSTIMPEGNFIDTKGNIIGRHKGICNYTIGQRKGLGLACGKPVFVKEIHPETNEIVISSNEELFSRILYAKDLNWISLSPDSMTAYRDESGSGMKADVKIRYRHKASAAHIYLKDTDCIKIIFDQPQRAVTRGQAAVLYDGDRVIGGGTIV